ncbi:MAG: 50S ribosomal protein L31 [Patescibacteria group bacterium]|nr:50S ribosomal protein L31 [Patescibacteria group bacterium]
MKEDLHPKYYPEAKVTCACGNKFTLGSTKPELEVEVCFACHPFYTGKSKFIDSEGRVEKFERKRKEAELREKEEKEREKKEKEKEKKEEEQPKTLKEMLERIEK